ncbi:MAG: hypothetical protein R3F33_17875 [Planctomycetota bacterium]
MKPLLLACLLAFPSHPVSRTVVPQAPTRVTEPQDSAKVRRFAQRLMRTIEEMYPTRQLEYDEAENRIVDRSSGLVIHLENLYRDYAALGLSERKDWLAAVARKLGASEAPMPAFDEVKSALTPQMWSRSKLEWLQLQNALRPDAARVAPLCPRQWALGPHILGALAVDGDEVIRYVVPEWQQAWNKELTELAQLAEARVPGLATGWAIRESELPGEHKPRLFSLQGDAFFAPSHLLDREGLQKLKLAEGSLASAPSCETLLIVEPGDETLLEAFVAQIIEANLEGSRLVCPIPLVYQGGTWQAWTPPADHPQRMAFRNLECEYLADAYGSQGKALEALLIEKGIDVYVAGYMLQEDTETGELTSISVWTRTVPTLMPEADLIALMDVDLPEDQQFLGMVRWQDLQKHCGQLFERNPDRYPVRYHVRGFPDMKALEPYLLEDYRPR